MKNSDRKKHWDQIYKTSQIKELSWYEQKPDTSLAFFKQFNVSSAAKIIDVGGGDSFLADNLLDMGYEDITVLDISEEALNKAKQRLGEGSKKIKWILSDITKFKPTEQYDFWHDRAAFHFLTKEKEIACYLEIVQSSIKPSGIFVLGTFSENGPQKCSGIEIRQYSEISITARLEKYFEKIKCITVDHKTPFDTIQNFVFCSFRKL